MYNVGLLVYFWKDPEWDRGLKTMRAWDPMKDLIRPCLRLVALPWLVLRLGQTASIASIILRSFSVGDTFRPNWLWLRSVNIWRHESRWAKSLIAARSALGEKPRDLCALESIISIGPEYNRNEFYWTKELEALIVSLLTKCFWLRTLSFFVISAVALWSLYATRTDNWPSSAAEWCEARWKWSLCCGDEERSYSYCRPTRALF